MRVMVKGNEFHGCRKSSCRLLLPAIRGDRGLIYPEGSYPEMDWQRTRRT